jgi:hypothetical protein
MLNQCVTVWNRICFLKVSITPKIKTIGVHIMQKKTILILMLVTLLYTSSAFGLSYYVFDDYGGTWHDASQDLDNQAFCWASSAANILAWGNWGTTTYSTEMQIFNKIEDHWVDTAGYPDNALNWWLDGTDPGGGLIDVAGGGNYWPGYNFDDYFYLNYENKSTMMSDVDYYLHNGYGVGIAGYVNSFMGHAINVWGYEYDPTSLDYYTGLYITDSATLTELQYIPISYNNITESWTLHDGVWTTGSELIEVLAFGPRISAVPEPSTIVLLGSGLFGLVSLRKRFKK